MKKRLSVFGVGPRILLPCAAYTIGAWAATRRWPEVFRFDWLPPAVAIAGLVLMAAGIVLWLTGVVTVARAYMGDALVTSGVFALVRHPVYAGWITLILPGLALFFGSWPMLLTPFFAYAIFRRLIRVEDEYLTQRFGQAYTDYCRRVNEIVPLPRFRAKG